MSRTASLTQCKFMTEKYQKTFPNGCKLCMSRIKINKNIADEKKEETLHDVSLNENVVSEFCEELHPSFEDVQQIQSDFSFMASETKKY